MPDRFQEDWRFANLKALDLNALTLAPHISPSQRERLIRHPIQDMPHASLAVFCNDEELHGHLLPQSLIQQGVIWTTMAEALKKKSDFLKKYFLSSRVSLGSDKFTLLHQAHCRSGVLLYIPKGVKVELPFIACHGLAGVNASIFPHTLIVAEEGSHITFVDYFSSDNDAVNFSCGMTEILLGEAARVTYIARRNFGKQTINFHHCSSVVRKNASLTTLEVHSGGKFSRQENHCALKEEGARSEMLSIALTRDEQELDQRTLQSHQAPRTRSDLLYKNVLDHRSKTVFQGMIRVEPFAAQTDAYQTNKNLLLSAEAEADSLPGLEILNDDVRCSHGATSGPVDEEQLFYMRARGIPLQAATQLLALGFCEEVLNLLCFETLKPYFLRDLAVQLAIQ